MLRHAESDWLKIGQVKGIHWLHSLFLFFLQWSAKTWKHTHKARRVSSNTHAYTLMRKIYPWKIYQACFSMVQNALSYLGNKVKNLIQSSLPLFYRLLFIVLFILMRFQMRRHNRERLTTPPSLFLLFCNEVPIQETTLTRHSESQVTFMHTP